MTDRNLAGDAASVAATDAGRADLSAEELLQALVLLRNVQDELAAVEPRLIAAARAAGVSWQALAPALGVASRQAAERRYLRATTANSDGGTRDVRVQAERDRRAGTRAVARWANDNTTDLRRLAARVTALTGLGADAATAVARLHDALDDPDAAALPGLLAATHRHLDDHPDLAARIGDVITDTDTVRRDTRRDRDQNT